MLTSMDHKKRIRIAAASTAMFLAGISAAGLGIHAGHPHRDVAATAPAASAQGNVAAATAEASPRSEAADRSAYHGDDGEHADDE